MLVLPITCENGCPDWSMIEMQGELEKSGVSNPDEEFPVGRLTLSAKARAEFGALHGVPRSSLQHRQLIPSGKVQHF